MYTLEEVKKLTWIAWRMGSIGSGDDEETDKEAFEEWWKDNALVILAQQ